MLKCVVHVVSRHWVTKELSGFHSIAFLWDIWNRKFVLKRLVSHLTLALIWLIIWFAYERVYISRVFPAAQSWRFREQPFNSILSGKPLIGLWHVARPSSLLLCKVTHLCLCVWGCSGRSASCCLIMSVSIVSVDCWIEPCLMWSEHGRSTRSLCLQRRALYYVPASLGSLRWQITLIFFKSTSKSVSIKTFICHWSDCNRCATFLDTTVRVCVLKWIDVFVSCSHQRDSAECTRTC